ncbi:hypothetical protein [Nakamurella leprariae]|uniref:TOMM leader peptide-binding protein n=1 Tax=Nakamurella leprariae TaxID=2803911 RepID=A0A939C1M2_9ACTN|nr:hypothetical protein [Nakamurella leprariae]MBM9467304.1 hypothetical protein [Nakamurella leprariae]
MLTAAAAVAARRRPAVPTDRPAEPALPYRLADGVAVVDRGDGSLQIGTEPPRCLVLHHPPRDAPAVFARLAGRDTDRPASVAPSGFATAIDLGPWWPVLDDLLDAGLLVATDEPVPAPPADGPWVPAERTALAHHHGTGDADRALQARADAVVAIHGTGSLAGGIAALLAAAGIGRVHRGAAGVGDPVVPELSVDRPETTRGAEALRSHAPAARLAASITVLAAHPPVDPAETAVLTWRALPHLVVQVSPTSAVVGPLVLPGRTSCLACTHRHRSDRDPAWPALWQAARRAARPAPALVVQAAATLAAREVLVLVDNLDRPVTLDGTLEWTLRDLAPRRRSWTPHPECGCRPA